MADFFKTLKNFSDLFNEKNRKKILRSLKDLDGIGQTQIDSLNIFFDNKKNVNILESLIKKLRVRDFKIEIKKGKFSNKNIMFTGGFEKMSRSEAKLLVENNGGKVLGSVSKKLNILVVGSSKPTKKKIDNAKKLNVKILQENEWYKILDL